MPQANDLEFFSPKKKFAKHGRRNSGDDDDEFDGTEATDISQIFATDRCSVEFKVVDFKLPFDVWWKHCYQPGLKYRDPSNQYKKIRTNLYVDTKLAASSPDAGSTSPCQCPSPTKKFPFSCGESCMNRAVFAECGPNCPNVDFCLNRRLSTYQWCKTLETFDTGTHGKGVRTTQPIPKGALLCEYVGEVVGVETFWDRMKTWYSECTMHYALQLDANSVIDAYRCGSIARFVNHSCDANCEVQKWYVNGHYRMGIFALKDIAAGEEVTYDYKFRSFRLEQDCACNSGQCRGKIGSDTSSLKLKIGRRLVDALQQPMQPNNKRDRNLIQRSRLMLMRNYNKVRRAALKQSNGGADSWNGAKKVPADPKSGDGAKKVPAAGDGGKKVPADPLVAQLIALKRNSTWRIRSQNRIGIDESRRIKLAQLLQFWCRQLVEAFASPLDRFLANSEFSLRSVAEKIAAVEYRQPDEFLLDVEKIFANVKENFSSANALEKILLHRSRRFHLKFCQEAKELLQLWDFDTTQFDAICPQNPDPPVGSYDPDDDRGILPEFADDLDPPGIDKVRCICGILLEEGRMVQCERCKYWQHQECERVEDLNSKYLCYRCGPEPSEPPSKDILLEPQPEIRFPGCVYYRTLANKRLQVRVDEAVYVKRFIDEQSKERLRLFYQRYANANDSKCDADEELKPDGGRPAAGGPNDDGEPMDTHDTTTCLATEQSAENDTKKLYFHTDLRVFRVERLLMSPDGDRFVFGFYYARPFETFCEPSRRFYRSELFVTPLYDTLPLEAVVGRCVVLDPVTYCKGRPKLPRYDESDVYVCELRVDKNQRIFDKLGKSKAAKAQAMTIINQEPYLFEIFSDRLKIKRDFTPFEVGEKIPKSFRRAFEQSVSSDESYKKIERRVLELTKRRRLNDLIAEKVFYSSDEMEY